MAKKKVRKHYPLDFKKKAVLMTTKEGITVGDVADELCLKITLTLLKTPIAVARMKYGSLISPTLEPRKVGYIYA